MTSKRWEQIKEAFWRVVHVGLHGLGAAPSRSGLDESAEEELQSLLDEHWRLAGAADAEDWPKWPMPVSLAERFDVLEHLGSGGFGDVYRARERTSGSIVAVKVLRDSGVSPIDFKRECRALSGIRHRNIIAVHELIHHRNLWMFSMEYVEGRSIRQYIDDGPLAERESRLRECFIQLAIGLNALHEHELLHRDLKPSNVLVASDGRVVVLDFGLVRAFVLGRLHVSTLAGTPEYMSPEQYNGSHLTAASDWYTFGVVLYETLTGELPFTGGPFSLRYMRRAGVPMPPDEIASIPADLNELCVGLLAIDPSARCGFLDVTRLLGVPQPASAVCAAPSQVIGRDRELQRLREAADRVSAEGPAIVHICGPAGSGKTELIRTFVAQLKKQGSVVALTARCFERESIPYQGLDDLVDQLCRHLTHLTRLDPFTSRKFGPLHLGALPEIFPVLQELQDRQSSERLAADSRTARNEAFSALDELLERLAERSLLVLAIDDLQNGGMEACRFFEHLLTSPSAPRIFLLLSYRLEAVDGNAWLKEFRDPRNAPLAAISFQMELEPLHVSV